MLVPALTGYIKRAREEKDYQFAATVLTAAQSAATYQYSLPSTSLKRTISAGSDGKAITKSTTAGGQSDITVSELVGTTSGTDWNCSFHINSDFVITGGTVTVNGAIYKWDGTSWTASEAES